MNLWRSQFLRVLLLAAGLGTAGAESVYFIGNSVTDTLRYDGLAAMAAARGKTQPWGRQMIPGAPLEWLWTHPGDGFTQSPYGYPTNGLPKYAWDVLSLQPFDRDLSSDVYFGSNLIGLLYGTTAPTATQLANRANSRILVFGRWPRQDDPARVGGVRTFDQLWLRPYPGDFNSNETADYMQKLTLAFRGTKVSGVSLADRAFMVPVGHVMYELNQQMKAGQIAGYNSIFQIYQDGIHLNNVGAYVAACAYFAAIYRETPVGLPVPSQYTQNLSVSTDQPLTPELAAAIQQTVWNVVQVQSLSGVPSAGNLLLTTTAVPPGYKDKPYSTSISAVGGVAPRTFTVTSGALPAGSTLATNGLLAGTPTAAGTFDFTVTVTDSSAPALTASRAFRLVIDINTVPGITTPTNLPSGNRGSRYSLQLLATNGNGTLTWSLTAGSLPAGLSFGGGGMLVGSPIQEGTFNFTATVADADVPADTDARTFTLAIAPPLPTTVLIPRTLSPVRVDGEFAETMWTLDRAATNGRLGTPNNNTTFGALWDTDALYLAVKVLDSQLATPGSGQDRDSVEIFLDAYNDKQAEFNVQHRQFRLGLGGALWERGGRIAAVRTAVLPVAGGYQIECAVPWVNLGITAGTNTVIGLDLGNNDVDSGPVRQSFLAYAGVDSLDPRPSQFASAILTGTAVSGTGGEPIAPSGPAPLAYESFDYSPGALHGLNGGTGWAAGWDVQNSDNVLPGFSAGMTNPLTFGQLGSTAGYAAGGRAYLTLGRLFNTSSSPGGPFASYLTNGNIGGPGRTLWFSGLLRKDANNDDSLNLSLHPGGIDWFTSDPRLVIGYFGSGSNVGGQRRVGLQYTSPGESSVTTNSGFALTVGQTFFIAAKIDFGSGSTPTVVSLWVNPVLGALPAASPSLVVNAAPHFSIRALAVYLGNGAGMGSFDEIRLGPSWDSVAPIPAQPVAPVSYNPLPSIFSSAQSVTLSCPTAGATIYYTLDNSTPTTNSLVYGTPLTISTTTTLRAFATKTGGYPSAASGGTYVIIPPTVVLDLQRTGTNLQLTWPQGTLLESGSLAGPWTTNPATSPYLLNPTADQKFFRAQVR